MRSREHYKGLSAFGAFAGGVIGGDLEMDGPFAAVIRKSIADDGIT